MDSKENTPGPPPAPPLDECQAWIPGALPSAQMDLVRAMQERFLSAFAEELAARLDASVTARLASTQPLSGTAFLESVETGGCLLTLDAEPVRGQLFVQVAPGLVAYLLRMLLGGGPAAAPVPRAVTEIELHILREIFELLAREMTAAWKPAGVAFRYASPNAPEITPAHGSMIVFDFSLDLDEAQQTFRIAIPAFLVRMAALQCAPAAAVETPGPVREMIFNALCGAKVNVEVLLSGSTIRMGDLHAMESGQILMLAQPAGAPVECHIGGKPKFHGEWMDHGDSQALLLL